MKNILLLTFILAISTFCGAQGIEFYKGSFEEAMKKAETEGKLIFIDAYTTWCGPCKRMAKTVFPQEIVGTYYNTNFVNLKVDMERGEGPTIGRKYGVRAYPTFLFVDGSGKLVSKGVGGMPPEKFVAMGTDALSKFDQSGNFEEKYNAGERDPEFILKYIQALEKAKKPALKVGNDYFRNHEGELTDIDKKIIFHSVSEADSRLFDMMVEHRSDLETMYGEELVEKKIYDAGQQTLVKGLQYESEDLIGTGLEKIRKHAPTPEPETFEQGVWLTYHSSLGNMEAYMDIAKSFVKAGDDQKVVVGNTILENFSNSEEALKNAEKWVAKSSAKSDNVDLTYTSAKIFYKIGDQDAALKTASRALRLAEENSSDKKQEIVRLIMEINQAMGVK